MERNKYELQREVLARKYETILKDFEDTNDDRRIAWNCYQQIIGACEAMRDSGMENNHDQSLGRVPLRCCCGALLLPSLPLPECR